MGEADDLARLSLLDDKTLLEELRRRYARDAIYTYIGDILLALNPFKPLPIYGRQWMHRYCGGSRGLNPPHVFAVADSAYRQMVATGRNQCCVISGESGAGKTESCKLLVKQLIKLSRGKSVLEQKILQVNPLLEAFGNAKTAMNDNSSRFGKYLQLRFREGHVTGAKINEYLLEKSRVVHQSPKERNFHIFYCMLAGLEQKRKAELRLKDNSTFSYLCGGMSCLEEKRAQFEEVLNALDLVGFETPFQNDIFTCLSVVLHLGNIQFVQDDREYAHIVSPQTGPLRTVEELLGIDGALLGDLLTVTVVTTRREAIRKHINKHKAQAARDAVAKVLYDRVFRWIVRRVNQLLAPSAEDLAMDSTEIGILDIFGFEKFECNSFEQLCINFANEQLQFFFNEHIFALENREYEREGIGEPVIVFRDNTPLLDMMFGKPIGLLALLDEQSSFPKATDKTFVTKLNQNFRKLSFFVPSKASATGTFIVEHYAGKVEYDSLGFLEKNRDSRPGGTVELLQTSSNALVRLIFTATVTRTGTLALHWQLSKRRTGRRTLAKQKKESVSVKVPTIGAQFKNSLLVLIEKMNLADPHFIRCIKPNTSKAPNNFEMDCVSTQLEYTGVLETVRIRREGYAFRPQFREFIQRYKDIVAMPKMPISAESCREVLKAAGTTDYLVGRTRVFLKYWHTDLLDKRKEQTHKAATQLQKVVRGFNCRRMFPVLLAAMKEEQERVRQFLSWLAHEGEEVYSSQVSLNRRDEDNPPGLSVAKPPAMAATKLLFLFPPSDINTPPPEPFFRDSDGEEEEKEEEEGEGLREEEEEVFFTLGGNFRFKKYGKEGSKKATIRWFQGTQADQLQLSSGCFPSWFHGFISKSQAERLLSERQTGTFLVRVSEGRFGFTLSLRVATGSRHHLISQLGNGRYVIIGEPKAHRSLELLVHYYSQHLLNAAGDMLRQPCMCSESLADTAASQPEE